MIIKSDILFPKEIMYMKTNALLDKNMDNCQYYMTYPMPSSVEDLQTTLYRHTYPYVIVVLK